MAPLNIRITLSILFLLTGCQAAIPSAQYTQSSSIPLHPPKELYTTSDQFKVKWTNSSRAEPNLWDEIRNGSRIPVPHNTRVEKEVNSYLKDKKNLYQIADTAEPYMYWIVTQLKKRNMPMELVFLPIVESDFNPQATSSAKAAGLWQIVPNTGKNYGLKQNKWYDGRRDVAASTRAALDILQYLNKMFKGDWLLTIAAYNSGEGRVLQAIKDNRKKGLPTDFWHLSLPKETAIYVPKLLALSHIIKYSQRYEITLPIPNKKRALTRVEISNPLKLYQAADMAGIPFHALKTFNSGYLRNVTSPNANGKQYIMLPASHRTQFQHALLNLKKHLKKWKGKYSEQEYELLADGLYKVKKGDTLSNIAANLSLSQKDLKQWNNLISDEIKSGQVLKIEKNASIVHKKQHQIKYKVRQGDSLSLIAEHYGVKIKDLIQWNKALTKGSTLKPGETLILLVAK